jgi:hypothetical protein
MSVVFCEMGLSSRMVEFVLIGRVDVEIGCFT